MKLFSASIIPDLRKLGYFEQVFCCFLVVAYCLLTATAYLRNSDFPYFDGAIYFKQALDFAKSDNFKNVDQSLFFNPLYTLFYTCLIKLLPFNALDIYKFHILIFYCFFGVSFYLIVNQFFRPSIAAFVLICMLSSSLVLQESIHGIHLFAGCWFNLITLIISQNRERELSIAAVVAAIGTFIRPEFVLLTIGLFCWQLFRIWRGHVARRATIAILTGTAALLTTFFITKPESNRSVIVLCQSYGWNLFRAEGGDFDPSRCDSVFLRDFGQPNSVLEAIFINPSAFMHHIFLNLENIIHRFPKLFNIGLIIKSGKYFSFWGTLIVFAGIVCLILIILQDVYLSTNESENSRLSTRYFKTFLIYSAITTVSIMTPLLLAQTHPKYLFGLLPIITTIALSIVYAVVKRISRITTIFLPNLLNRTQTLLVKMPLLPLMLGLAAIATYRAYPNFVQFRPADKPPTSMQTFAAIADKIATMQFSQNRITLVGHSAVSYVAILAHDRPDIIWNGYDTLFASQIKSADILVLHPRFVKNVTRRYSEDWLRTTASNDAFLRVEHIGQRHLALYIRKSVLAEKPY